MSAPNSGAPDASTSHSNSSPHVPPHFFVPIPSSSSSQPQLHLSRTRSQKDIYDADTGATDSEFALHSRSRTEDLVSSQGHGGATTPGQTARRTTSGGRHSHARSKSGAGGAQSAGSGPGPGPGPGGVGDRKHETVLEELRNYKVHDEAVREAEMREVERVRRGSMGSGSGSGSDTNTKESTLHSPHSSAGAGAGADVDLEKQANAQSAVDEGLTGEAAGIATSASADVESGHDHEKEKDPHLVTWDSPDSMENPRNWSLHRRWVVALTISSYTFLSPLASSMIAPALPLISSEFNVTSSVQQSIMLSVFVLAYAFGPLFLGPLSEMFGRKLVLQGSNLFFIIWNVACGLAQTSAQMTVFRFLCGLGGSAPLAVGGGALSDLFMPEERGLAMAVYSLAPLLGPVIGPIVGGWITQELGQWRWIFWVSSIAAGVTASIGLFVLPETYAPRILALKAKKLRKETGNDKLHTAFDDNSESWQVRFKRNLVRPFILLTTQPIVMVLAAYMALIYGTMYLLLTTFPTVFEEIYGEKPGIASLNYISLGLGFTLGGQIGGRVVDRIYRRLKEQNGGKGQPEFKLPFMMGSCFFVPVGLLIYGWTAQEHTHWIGPNVGAALFGIGMLGSFLCIQNFLVDTYLLFAASALSAAAFLRSLAGFGFPLFAPTMYSALGNGWGNSVLALAAAVIGIPAPFLIFKYGPKLRAMSTYAAAAS